MIGNQKEKTNMEIKEI